MLSRMISYTEMQAEGQDIVLELRLKGHGWKPLATEVRVWPRKRQAAKKRGIKARGWALDQRGKTELQHRQTINVQQRGAVGPSDTCQHLLDSTSSMRSCFCAFELRKKLGLECNARRQQPSVTTLCCIERQSDTYRCCMERTE